MGDVSTSITRNLEIIGISNGVAKLIRAEGGVFGGSSDLSGSHSGTFGPYTLSDVDIPLLIRMNLSRKSAGSDVFVQAYSSAAIENLVFSPATGPSVTLAALHAKNVRFKEVEGGLLSLAERIAKHLNDGPEKSEADKIAIVRDYMTFFDTVSIGTLDLVGFETKGPDRNEIAVAIARIAFNGATSDAGANLRMEGVDLSAPNGRLKIGSISQKGFDIAPTLKKLRAEIDGAGVKLENIEI